MACLSETGNRPRAGAKATDRESTESSSYLRYFLQEVCDQSDKEAIRIVSDYYQFSLEEGADRVVLLHASVAIPESGPSPQSRGFLVKFTALESAVCAQRSARLSAKHCKLWPVDKNVAIFATS